MLTTAAACTLPVDEAPSEPGPIVETIDAPREVTSSGSVYEIPIRVRHRHPDGLAVTHVRYRVADLGVDQTQAVEGASPGSTAIEVVITLPASTPKQTYEYAISLRDARGTEGPPMLQEITLL
jgi:hypothetical protein